MTTQDSLIDFINEHLRTAGWDPVDTNEIVSKAPGDTEVADSKSGEAPPESKGFNSLTIGLKPGNSIVAVLQASVEFKDPISGQEYVFRSAQEIQKQQGGELPLCFITDGTKLYFWESQVYPPVHVAGFPTKDDLLRLAQRREKKHTPVDDSIVGFTQDEKQNEAVLAVLKRIEEGKRQSLVVLEGTIGKTAVGLTLCSVLLNSGRARRMLYIVDSPLLREHILRVWSQHVPEKPCWPEKPGETFKMDRMLYVMSSRGIRMFMQAMNSPGKYLSPFFFDGIVVDIIRPDATELDWRNFGYFMSNTIGVASRPVEDISSETYKAFGCYDGDPTFKYTRQEASSQDSPTLCPIEVLRTRPRFRIRGISGPSLPPPVLQYLERSGQDEAIADFQGTELERKVINASTNGVIIREFMEDSIKDSDGVLPGKTVLFAVSKDHARRFQDLFDRFYPEYAGRFARVFDKDHHAIRGSGGLLDRFIGESFPRVAIVVGRLDWEIQIPEVVNIVIAKPVFDKASFERLIETGTASLPEKSGKEFGPWCSRKEQTLIFDCWENFAYFQESPPIRESGAQSPAVRHFRALLQLCMAVLTVDNYEKRDTVIQRVRSEIEDLVNEISAIEDEPAIATVIDNRFWDAFDEQSISFMEDRLSPFFNQRVVEEPNELRFLSDIIELKAALLEKNQDLVDTLREIIIAQVLDLPSSHSGVLRERDLVDSVQHPAWWISPNEQNIDTLAERLAPLMKFRELRADALQEFSVADLTTVERKYEYGPDQERISRMEYRRRIRTHVEHQVPGNPFYQKVALGEKIAHTEVVRVSETLSIKEPFITDDILEDIYDLRNPRLMHVVRYNLDLEPLEPWSESVYHSFAEFMSTRAELSVKQVQFLHTLRSFIIQKKALSRADLKELPFTRIHPEGVLGVFSQAEAQEIIAFAEALVIS